MTAFYRKITEMTDRPQSKWHIVDSTKRKHVKRVVLQTVMEAMEHALQTAGSGANAQPLAQYKPYINVKFNLLPSSGIED